MNPLRRLVTIALLVISAAMSQASADGMFLHLVIRVGKSVEFLESAMKGKKCAGVFVSDGATSVGDSNLMDCYIDCKDALCFLVKNAEKYGIDPARIVPIGASAGGGLAMMMAYSHDDELKGEAALDDVPVKVNAVISWFGMADFFHRPEEFSPDDEKRLVLFQTEEREKQSNLISPAWYMNQRAEKIPTLMVHGDKDPVVPFSQSVCLKVEADRLGRPVEFIPLTNMKHAFQPVPGEEIRPGLETVWQRSLEFILANNPPPSR